MEPTALQQVAALRNMPLSSLRERWRALFGRDAPAAYKPQQLVRRLAWRIQELRYGGLSDAVQQRLRDIADGDDLARGQRRTHKRKGAGLAAGTRLVRHWRGMRHEVTVCRDGMFEYGGKQFRTLSAVAKTISGQHCSGPRFFGLPRVGKEAS